MWLKIAVFCYIALNYAVGLIELTMLPFSSIYCHFLHSIYFLIPSQYSSSFPDQTVLLVTMEDFKQALKQFKPAYTQKGVSAKIYIIITE